VIARILLLAGIVALVAALVQWRVVDREPATVAEDTTRPGYFLTGVDLEEFGIDGKLRIGLQSISATEDPASGVVRLSDVAVDYHAPTGRLWHLTSNEARVPPGGRTVEFEGDVRLAGQPGEDPVAAELLTPRLVLDTVTEVADTRSPVELAFGPHRMRAIGMRADLKSGNMSLEADVNGRFTP
jgi:lipopolysaccharide export system protein LptC